MRRTKLALNLAALMVAAISLSGCDTWRSAINYVRSDNANVCPDANILANTSVLPAFDPAQGADPSNVVYTAKFTDLKTRCDYSKRINAIDANVTMTIKATRAPGGEAAHYKLPYYVAVTAGGQIVDKQTRWLEFDFPKASAEVQKEELVDGIEIAVARDKKSYEYHLLVGFQLTQAQIDYNKKMGQYLP
ncbi:hypothetical protein [Rhizomicrobium electricum]|jgi:hypothetical protein|nr:hypothetical protein [Rhizomicrobium electricum]NIJ47687.1 hypothetical protein [Rhizomicrobium electricum]